MWLPVGDGSSQRGLKDASRIWWRNSFFIPNPAVTKKHELLFPVMFLSESNIQSPPASFLVSHLFLTQTRRGKEVFLCIAAL